MNQQLYDILDFPRIETFVYSEEDHPREILGAHKAPHGILIQTFLPGAEALSVRTLDDGKLHRMELVDEAGFFAVLMRKKDIPSYEYVQKTPEGERVWKDPYAFPGVLTEKEEKQSETGNLKRPWQVLGAQITAVNGVPGVSFAVWAPNALRVSVVGSFNDWDGRVCQMNRLPSGIFELFVPGLGAGTHYQYELKLKTGLVYVKSDPYARCFDRKADLVSVVTGDPDPDWTDLEWTRSREERTSQDAPVIVRQLDFGSWCRAHDCTADYAAAAKLLADDLQRAQVTHVLFAPLAEYADDATDGYETWGYYAPTARYGTPEAFAVLVDTLHAAGIGVLMDFVASYFAGGNSLLAAFDGTFLYEHLDPRRGMHPAFGTHIFNYGRPEVCNFLTGAMRYWAEELHVDGFRLTDVATMLFQDFGREEGEWIANLYGGNENLEAVEFLKQMNQALHTELPGILTIAEEMAGWNGLTAPVEQGGIGFDLKWNHWWADEFLNYLHLDPLFRGAHQDDLAFLTVYAFSERFLIGFGKDEADRSQSGLTAYLSGNEPEVRAANLRLALAYAVVHPGKKLLHGRIADEAESRYLEALAALYHSRPALYQADTTADGFEWISNLDWERNLLVFLRKTEEKAETLLVVCNFSNVAYEDVLVGVPFAGKYKEIFNSDAADFGGSGVINPRVKFSRPVECDERSDSIKIKIPPLGISVYQYSEQVAKRADNKTARSNRKKG